MPTKPQSPCTIHGCPARAVERGRCAAHATVTRQQATAAYEATRPSAAARGYGAAWRRRRAAYLARNPDCVLCGQPATAVDHRVPLRAGGADDETNYQALCQPCHSQKTNRQDGGGWQRRRE